MGNGQGPIDQVEQALSVGFNHVGVSIISSRLLDPLAENFVDTAQSYGNEGEAGVAIRESGLSREDIFITTKYSGTDGLDIPTSIENSLKNVRT